MADKIGERILGAIKSPETVRKLRRAVAIGTLATAGVLGFSPESGGSSQEEPLVYSPSDKYADCWDLKGTIGFGGNKRENMPSEIPLSGLGLRFRIDPLLGGSYADPDNKGQIVYYRGDLIDNETGKDIGNGGLLVYSSGKGVGLICRGN